MQRRKSECLQKQLQYLKACDKLGDFYYKNKNYKTALKYFELAADFQSRQHDEDEKVEKLRMYIASKAADMYYNGIGIEKNIKAAFHLHYLSPFLLAKIQNDNYSKMYFGDTAKFYGDKNLYLADSIQTFGINPFYLTDYATAKELSTSLKPILEKLSQDSLLSCYINLTFGFLPFSEYNSYRTEKFIQMIEHALLKKEKYQIVFERLYEENGFSYKEFSLPMVSVILKK